MHVSRPIVPWQNLIISVVSSEVRPPECLRTREYGFRVHTSRLGDGTPRNVNELRAEKSHTFDTIDEVLQALSGTVERGWGMEYLTDSPERFLEGSTRKTTRSSFLSLPAQSFG